MKSDQSCIDIEFDPIVAVACSNSLICPISLCEFNSFKVLIYGTKLINADAYLGNLVCKSDFLSMTNFFIVTIMVSDIWPSSVRTDWRECDQETVCVCIVLPHFQFSHSIVLVWDCPGVICDYYILFPSRNHG